MPATPETIARFEAFKKALETLMREHQVYIYAGDGESLAVLSAKNENSYEIDLDNMIFE